MGIRRPEAEGFVRQRQYGWTARPLPPRSVSPQTIRLFPFCACGLADYTASTAEEEDKNLRYNQILIIIAENRAYDDIIGKPYAPHNKAGRVCGGA